MKWELVLIVVAVIVVLLTFNLRAESTLSTDEARKHLAAGAKLIDVRTVGEFEGGHISSAINIPLDHIKTGITNTAPDKGTVILLHCRSGRRSGIAVKELRAIGYTNVFNLGSYQQAEKAVQKSGN